MKSDAVRLQATGALRRQVMQRRGEFDRLQLDNDQYRRVLLKDPDENALPA